LDIVSRASTVGFPVESPASFAYGDQRRIGFIETTRQDIHYAVRGLRRAPAFALVVIATIGLGLGFNTAAFTIFNAYALRPLAVSDPYSLYQVYWQASSGGRYGFTWPQYQQVRAGNPAISEALAASCVSSNHHARGRCMRISPTHLAR
jgi:hypothetical protein